MLGMKIQNLDNFKMLHDLRKSLSHVLWTFIEDQNLQQGLVIISNATKLYGK